MNNGTSGAQGGFNLQSLLSKLSFTGNVMIDSFILMNAFTFMKGYAEIVLTTITSFSYMIIIYLFDYFVSFVKSKFTGKVIFKTHVDETDPLYKMIYNNIIDSNLGNVLIVILTLPQPKYSIIILDGDVHEDWKFKWLKVESEFSHDDTSYWENWKRKDHYHSVPVELGIDYSSPSGQKLKFAQNYGISDRKVIIFKHITKPKKNGHDFFKIAR